jgi:hypothetical protein
MKQIFKILLVICIIGIIYYFYKPKTPTPFSIDELLKQLELPPLYMFTLPPPTLMTMPPTVTTLYPLTEQAILKTIKGNYSTPLYSNDQFNALFKSLQSNYTIDRLANSHKNAADYPDLKCYVLYTDVFISDNVRDNKHDNYINDYDIVGAYFFLTLKDCNLTPSEISSIHYYDIIKKIVIPDNVFAKITSYWNLVDKNTTTVATKDGTIEMPTAIFMLTNYKTLDDLVHRISRYLFSNYKKRNLLSYQTLTNKCT